MGRLRIIAGEFRGRRIAVPAGGRARPTAERVREALFGILGDRVADARLMDAYSGSGALGFEALSRGARQVVFVEADRRTLPVLRENAAELGVTTRCTFVCGRVDESLRSGRVPGSFDLILADPPYAAGEAAGFLPLAGRILVAGGLIVLERDLRTRPVPGAPALELFRSSAYGRNCLDFYRLAGK